MAGGAKKKKAAKRKNHKHHHQQQPDSPSSPNPNPNPNSPPPLIHHHENGKDKRPVVVEDEGEETFETPRLQLDTPRFPPETPYYSMENLKIGRRDEFENVLVGEKFKGLDLEIPSVDWESSKEMKLEESEDSNARKDDEALKGVKLDEFVHVTEEESSIEKEMTLDKLETEEIEESVLVNEEKTLNASIEAVYVSSSNEKDAKVVLWPDKEVAAINGDVNGDVVPSEKGGEGDGNRNLGRQFQQDEGSKLENLVGENGQPIPVIKNYEDVLESVQGMRPQIDVDLTSNNSKKSVEKSSLPAENSVRITGEASRDSKAPHENLLGSVGASNVSSHGRVKEAAEPSLHAEKIDIAQRKEVARGPPVLRRATFWNCCGLLEVLTSSDR